MCGMSYLPCRVFLRVLAMSRITTYLISGCLVQEPYPALGSFPYTMEKAKTKLVSFAEKPVKWK